jgi:hypothetical protein
MATSIHQGVIYKHSDYSTAAKRKDLPESVKLVIEKKEVKKQIKNKTK